MANVDHLLPRVGERIGHYQLVQELARGGFGVVFRALQVGLNATVAIKVLAPPNLSQVKSQQLLQRFQQEARVAQKLQHPCAIKVRDYGRTQAGLLYLVTDFIDGRELSDVLKEQPLSEARTVHIASQVLGCLIEAHSLGIIHRDLKPSNIMLRDIYGERDSVTVLDFGVAKVSESRDGVVTQVGITLGTPYYTAPEQCRGERALDGRADLYSLGLIIAECLTGRRVVGTDSSMAAIYIQAGAQPLEFEPGLHQSRLFPVIQRATEKQKEKRYPDGASMRQALEQAARGALPDYSVVATTPVQASAVHAAVAESSWPSATAPYLPAEPAPPARPFSDAQRAQGTFSGGAPVVPPPAGGWEADMSRPPAASSWEADMSRPPAASWEADMSRPAAAVPPVAHPPKGWSRSHARVRPRRRGLGLWLWATAAVLVGAVGLLLLGLFGNRESVEQPVPEPATDRLEQPRAPERRAPEPVEPIAAPPPRDAPSARPFVRARVHFVSEDGEEREVTLEGCGLASGLRVGQRAPVGDTGIDLEITRFRGESRCTARTSATAAQLEGITEVVFRARSPEDRGGN